MIKFDKSKNEFIQGIPARDLTDQEWSALSEEQVKAAEKSGLYKYVPGEIPAPLPEPAEETESPAPKKTKEK